MRAATRDEITRAMAINHAAVSPPVFTQARRFCAWAAGLGVLAWLFLSLDVDPVAPQKGLETLGRFLAAMASPNPGLAPHRIFSALVETLAMAFLASTAATLIAIPLGALGARTVIRSGLVHFGLRRALDLFRGVPALVWALILVSAIGLGPIGGICAMILADTPSLTKLFAETLENTDERPRESVRATGAGEIAALRYAIVPQAAPLMASQSLFFLESNFRNAAVLGLVGAGGIGFELEERIRVFAFDEVSFILIVYVACVLALDQVSSAVRRRLTA